MIKLTKINKSLAQMQTAKMRKMTMIQTTIKNCKLKLRSRPKKVINSRLVLVTPTVMKSLILMTSCVANPFSISVDLTRRVKVSKMKYLMECLMSKKLRTE